MTTRNQPASHATTTSRIPVVGGVTAIVIAGIVLLGWVFDISQLRAIVASQVSMKANTALGFLLSGSVLLCVRTAPSRHSSVARWTLCTLLMALSMATLVQYISGANFRIDQLIFAAPTDSILTTSPGRMALTTAIGFLLIATAVLIDHWRTGVARAATRTLASLSVLIGLASVLGYAYGAPALYLGHGGGTAMSLPTALLFIVVGISVIWLRPGYGFPAMLVEDSMVGTQVRSLVPMVLGPPLLVGAAVATGYGRLYEGEFAIALTSLGSMLAAGLVAAVSLVVLRRSDVELNTKDRALGAIYNGVFIVDQRAADRPVVYVNSAFKSMTGYAAAECLGRNARFLTHGVKNEQVTMMALTESMKNSRRDTFELQYRRRDGSLFWVRLSLAPVANYEGTVTHFVGVIDDVTIEREREAQIKSALDEAHDANHMRNTFVRLVSHELRTPLNAALTWIRLMEIDDSPKTRASGMDVVAQSIESQSRLIDDLVDVTRFAAAGVRLEVEAVDVQALMHATVEEMRPALEEHHQLGVTVDAGQYEARLDPLRIQQILRNLLTNANKYTPPDGRIDVLLTGADDSIALIVSDTGVGLTAEQIEQMFEPFWRAESHQPGLGVGLSIVASLVSAHGGSISVKSEGRDMGSAFTVRLPRDGAPEKHTSLHEEVDVVTNVSD